MKFRSIQLLTYVAEALIMLNMVAAVINFTSTFHTEILSDKQMELLSTITENPTMAFIIFFRYFYIVSSLGWKELWLNRKEEIIWYVLFTTHEVPFHILEGVSGLSWTYPKTLYKCIMLMGCLYVTARGKMKDKNVRSDSKTQSLVNAKVSNIAKSVASKRLSNYKLAAGTVNSTTVLATDNE